MKRLMCLAITVLVLGACTEQPQTIGGNTGDEAPFVGSKYPYAAPGWSSGDRKSWQEQLKVRTQRGQNEYSRM